MTTRFETLFYSKTDSMNIKYDLILQLEILNNQTGLLNLLKFQKFTKKYSFLYDRQATSQIGREENLTVTFGFAYRYTNFSINSFFISEASNPNNNNNNSDEHEVRIYRFWAYDPINGLPQETAYFMKMTQIINVNNSSQASRNSLAARRNQLYPRDGYNNMANYLLHSGFAIQSMPPF